MPPPPAAKIKALAAKRTTAKRSGRKKTRPPTARSSKRNGHAALPPTFRRNTPHGLRVAAIDIGTNSVHMVIVEVTDQLTFRTLGTEKDLTRLGSSALVHHRLTRRAMVHTYQILSRY